jgi:uncharacterized membrane protein YfcA
MDSILTGSVVLGALVGLILALTGAGGAILAVPLLLFLLHLGVAQAAPVALLAVGLSAAVGAVIGLRTGIIRYRAAVFMAGAGMLFSPLGLWLAHQIPNGPLTLLFAAILAYVALRMFRQAAEPQSQPVSTLPLPPCQRNTDSGRFIWTAACTRALTVSGIGADFLSGLLGVGGGFVIVPALRRATNAPMQSVVATSLAVITLVSIAGVLSSAIAGAMNWRVGLPFAAGAIMGMLSGRLLASRLSGPRLQQGFALVAGLIAIGMVVKVLLTA